MSANERGIHNASFGNRTPCIFPSQVWHQLIFPEAVSTSHLIYNAYIIEGSCVFERQLNNFCLQNKTAAARGKRDNDG